MATKEDAVPEWRVEPFPRAGKTLLIFYRGEEVRGQIETQDDEEKDAWLRLMPILNSKPV